MRVPQAFALGIAIGSTVAIGAVTAADGSVSDGPSTAGEVHWRDFTTHTAENIGETEAHALAIELKPCR